MRFLGKEVSGPYTIPSGIITTKIEIIKRIANEIPEVGVITTKSIGLEPRTGNTEPLYAQYAEGSYVNAVGLANPGAEEFAKQLKTLQLPKDKFLLTSIFGKSTAEIVEVARILAPYSDGLEVNLSCPHAKGYGMAMGQDPALVKEITAAIKAAVKIPVIPKLTPNVPDITLIAKAAAEGGADAICAINTVGPGLHTVEGHPVLSNTYGGLSGSAIKPIGLKCVKQIAQATGLPIIGCGGIATAKDVREYQAAGASIIGIGSALTHLSTEELKDYFTTLSKDLQRGTDKAKDLLRKDKDMYYNAYKLVENKRLAPDLSLLTLDGRIRIKPGQFVFAWLPGSAEKPFSVLDENPLTLAVQDRGCFTKQLVALRPGATIHIRGPYGQPVRPGKGRKAILVGGGTGLAALYQLARDFPDAELFMGARDKAHLFYIEEAQRAAIVHVTTDDGSAGRKGFVTEALKDRLEALKGEEIEFYNCGPEPMIRAAVAIEKAYAPPERIHNSVDYVTKCGVGICGSCTSKTGKRTCVDGPFIGEDE